MLRRKSKAGVGVSPAMDLAASADALHDLANRIYEYKFLRGLRRRVRRKAALYPELYDVKYLRGLRSIRDFDEADHGALLRICRRPGLLHPRGFRQCSRSHCCSDSRSAREDDPFIRILPETRQKLLNNPNITFVETASGGHCAFLAEPNGYDGRWAERQAIRFIQATDSSRG